MTNQDVKQILEALLMSANEPLTTSRLRALIKDVADLNVGQLSHLLSEMADAYSNNAFELKEVASGWRVQIKKDYSDWVQKLWALKPPRYSQALLEVLALIVYQQPITRAEIEKVRGVSVSSNIIRTLMSRKWICVIGHRQVPGKPAIYGTTKHFLDYFNLKDLADLPPLKETTSLEQSTKQLELLGVDLKIGAKDSGQEQEAE